MTLTTASHRQSPDFAVRNPFGGTTLATLPEADFSSISATIYRARDAEPLAQTTLRLSGDAATFLDGEMLHCAIVAGGADRQAVVTLKPVGVVVKPSPRAPLAADHLVRLCAEAGFPPDLVQILHGGAEVAGLALKRASGLVRCLMELGGNDPLFVRPDADLGAAAAMAIVMKLPGNPARRSSSFVFMRRCRGRLPTGFWPGWPRCATATRRIPQHRWAR